MKLLWHSNATHVSTGYGVQSNLMVPRIQRLGHKVAISALWGLEGGVQQMQTADGIIPVYPKGFAPYSQDSLPLHADHFGADAVVTLVDAWVMAPKVMTRPWIAYFPVDMEPAPRPVVEKVAEAAERVAMSRFGQAEMHRLGHDCHYVPHCYDAAHMRPGDRQKARDYLKADGRFIVGVVAANQGSPPRKCFPQIFEAFKAFSDKHPEALLYIHSHLGPEKQGIDLAELVRFYGLSDQVARAADQYQLQIGYPVEAMADLYSAMDVLVSTSMGEGFGVPILEAQACGTPVITGDWTAMPEITRTGITIPKSEAYRYHVPGFSNMYLPNPAAITDALEQSLEWRYDRAEVSAKVTEYEADHVVAEHWAPLLAEVERKISAPEPAPDTPAGNRAQRRKAEFKAKRTVTA